MHAWTEGHGPVLLDAGYDEAVGFLCDLILVSGNDLIIEVANPRLASNQMRRVAWAEWNMAFVGALYERLYTKFVYFADDTPILVSPSDKWTGGLKPEVRQLLAKVESPEGFTKDNLHNLCECQAMLYFYRKNPERWTDWPSHLANL